MENPIEALLEILEKCETNEQGETLDHDLAREHDAVITEIHDIADDCIKSIRHALKR